MSSLTVPIDYKTLVQDDRIHASLYTDLEGSDAAPPMAPHRFEQTDYASDPRRPRWYICALTARCWVPFDGEEAMSWR